MVVLSACGGNTGPTVCEYVAKEASYQAKSYLNAQNRLFILRLIDWSLKERHLSQCEVEMSYTYAFVS